MRVDRFVTPTKIVCVGTNYAEHAKELGTSRRPKPIIFLKTPSALLPPRRNHRASAAVAAVDFEGELAW